ncbi:MAG: hypothetical protein FWC10_09425 [Lentimicrobiaceae bacterium]|nr:hypothetical protein [Lentimicrobiaceae bacterium]
MKTTSKIRFLNILCVLALMFTGTACCKEGEPKCGEVIITDSWITSPKWMANFVDDLINNTVPPFEVIYVYFIEHNGQVYFHIRGDDIGDLGITIPRAFFLFTCMGDRIYSEFTHLDELPPGTLGWDLVFSRNITRVTIWSRVLISLNS